MLSWYALSSHRRGLIACVFALIGALIGGMLVWHWALDHPDAIRSIFAWIPAINEAMIAEVRSQLANTGIFALFLGPLTSIPYKLYALEAADLGIGLAAFLAVSMPVRLVRFVAVTVFVGTIGQLLQRKFSLSSVRRLHLGCWSMFYTWYFWVMSAYGHKRSFNVTR